MDSFYNENNKLNVLKSSNIPKLTTPRSRGGNYYSSPENLIKYLRSNSLSSSSSSGKSSFRSSVSPQLEKTPRKVVEEDVLVMDGVLVTSDTNIVRSSSSSSSPSGGIGFYKSDICRAWEEIGHCRYGSKCQFAHGKEEMRPNCFPFRTKSEIQMMYKSYTSPVPNTYGSKPRLLHSVTESTAVIAQKDLFTRSDYTSSQLGFTTPIKKQEETIINSLSTVHPEITRANTSFTMKIITDNRITPTFTTNGADTRATTFTGGGNWSPQDDGIEVTLPSFPEKTPSREDVVAYIDDVLYGLATKKRLPVFSAICPQ